MFTLRSVEDAQQIADDIGYPVIIKAAAGGGGLGMRVVHEADVFHRAYQETTASAQALFGDSSVYVERYLETARHVEIQVLADNFGNTIHLGERDCSVQRRHQKLVEESPAPRMLPGLAARMGQPAVRERKRPATSGRARSSSSSAPQATSSSWRSTVASRSSIR